MVFCGWRGSIKRLRNNWRALIIPYTEFMICKKLGRSSVAIHPDICRFNTLFCWHLCGAVPVEVLVSDCTGGFCFSLHMVLTKIKRKQLEVTLDLHMNLPQQTNK